MPKLRVALFTDTFLPQVNGVTNTLSCLCSYFERKNIDYLLFAPSYGQGDGVSASVLRFDGLRPRIYPECSLAFPQAARVTERLARFAPDVVHILTECGVGFSGLRAARALRIPVVMSYHTNFDRYLGSYHLANLGAPLWAYLKWFHSFALANLCPSADTMAALRQRGFSKLGIWSRGIDPRRFSPAKRTQSLRRRLGAEGKTVYLYVGRMAAEKDLDTYAKAIRRFCRPHREEALFVFTGDGPYLPALRAMELPGAVFTGALTGSALSEIYASADVFVFPSGTETFGNVLLEAMASGLAPICTDSGGVRDFSADGQNALVFPFGSDTALARCMERALNPSLRARLRAGALKTAASRSWDSVFDGLVGQYRAAARHLAKGPAVLPVSPFCRLRESVLR